MTGERRENDQYINEKLDNILTVVVETKTEVVQLKDAGNDRETRIRVLEKDVWKRQGATGILGGLVGALLSVFGITWGG